MSDLVGNPEDRFFCVAAQFSCNIQCKNLAFFMFLPCKPHVIFKQRPRGFKA